MSNISRRDFLKGVAAGAVSVAGISMLGGAAAPVVAHAETAEAAKTAAVPAWTELNPQDESYDTCTTDFAELFSPIQVGHMTLKNRIIKSAAGSDTMKRGATELTQNAIDYYGRFADGGTALVILEDGTIGNFGFNQFAKMAVETYEEGIAQAKRIADRVHEGGAYIGTQLGIGTPLEPGDANAYTTEEIHAFVKEYGAAAARLKQAGFDCVEIKGATTDGLNQFLRRAYNAREDEYGSQTEENRVRFFSEIIAEIRAQVGDDFSILVLINAMEENDQNLGASDKFISVEEAQYLAKALETAGADLVQVRVATGGQEANCWATDTNHCAYKAHGTTGYGTQFDYATHWDGLQDGAHSGVGAFIPLAAKIKEAVSVPVGCASVMDPRLAPDLINNAIRDGNIDVVFINRALTVDPELPIKLQEGRRDEIAPCTHCFHCHGKPYGEAEVCRVNVTTQHAYTDVMPEGYELTPTDAPKKVLVIGGGVAGMEAARIAAERGHSVTLVEKTGVMGGMLAYANAIKGSHERLMDLKAYLERQCELKGVEIVKGVEATVDTVKEYAPDTVIVAVGGGRESRYSGANVMNMDSFTGKVEGDNIVILGANLQATDVAQYLLAQGKKLTLIHGGTESVIDREQSRWVRTYVKAHLYAHGVRIVNEAEVKEVTGSSVTYTYGNGKERTIPADTVLECYDMVPNTALAEEIEAAGYQVIMAGCDAPSNIQTAIYAGHMAARYL